MAILKRPMFRKGGSTNEGIMHGLERRGYADSNWEDLAEAYGYGKGTSTDVRNPLNYLDPEHKEKMIEHYKPTEIDWSWLKPRKEKVKLPSGKEVWLEGGIPMKEEDLIQMAPEFVTMPFPQDGKIPPPPLKKKKDDGGLDSVNPEDVKDSVSDVNKERLKLFAPHMQKRMMNDALAAASEKFGESTGDTQQDIANAISAAAAATGGTKDIYDKVSMLTLQGEIQKDIARETYKPNATQSMIDFYRGTGMKDKEIVSQLSKDKLDITDFMRTATTTKGAYKSFAQHEHGDNPKWGGSLPEDKKGAVDGEKAKEIMEVGKFYFDQDKLIYVQVVLEDGEKKIKKVVPK